MAVIGRCNCLTPTVHLLLLALASGGNLDAEPGKCKQPEGRLTEKQ
jgi:hypothetical protein